MSELASKTCEPCRGGVPPLKGRELLALLQQLPGWRVIDEHHLARSIIGLQDFFNSFSPRLAPKTIRNMHACLRTVLAQGKTWGLIRVNPAQGVRLPRKKARKPPVLLPK